MTEARKDQAFYFYYIFSLLLIGYMSYRSDTPEEKPEPSNTTENNLS
ncbi:hypothetical protein GCM10025791_37970 [Halioxenophilus aromaticivorans]|uniref:Uncharacterized protein n=1 Tax=Halioxenophilus aromaticivorans TaxID=1306992 RepID=A0AAV3U707_9ALTE